MKTKLLVPILLRKTPWYLAGGIGLANVLGAWDFKNAPSYAASKISLANPSAANLLVDGTAYPTWARGTGLTFVEGSSQYLTISSAITTAVPVSMVCRFNADHDTAAYVLMSICDTAALNFFALYAYGTIAGDPVGVRAGATGASYGVTSSGFTVGSWFTGAAVCSATNLRAAYINGGNKGTDTVNLTPVGIDSTFIGVYYNGTTLTSYFDGKIAACAFYNLALFDEQELEIHNAMVAL